MTFTLDPVRRARLRVAEKITDLIGDTPIVRLRACDKDTPGVELWAKCEFLNPGGSVKDRAAYQMIRDAIRNGQLKPGQAIIDSTSGNTGVAYALIGGALGYPVTLVMPGNVSWARRKITQAFGTRLVFSDPLEGSDGSIRLCREMVAENPGTYYYPDQYSNPSNALAHYNTTGREIWEQTEGRVTHFVTGIGTTGTVMGTGRCLKEYRRDIGIYAVEPDDALHGLEGLKHMESLAQPPIYHPEELDGVTLCHRRGLGRVRAPGRRRASPSGTRRARPRRGLHAKGPCGGQDRGRRVVPRRADRYFEAPIMTQVQRDAK
jgi:cysteine synthase B